MAITEIIRIILTIGLKVWEVLSEKGEEAFDLKLSDVLDEESRFEIAHVLLMEKLNARFEEDEA